MATNTTNTSSNHVAVNDDNNPMAVFEVIAAHIRSQQPPTASVHNDPMMRITHAEKDRAVAIKEAVENCSRCRNLTDFEYVHYALTTHGETMEKIRHRVYMMQCFRDEYNVFDEALQGVHLFRQLTVQQPGLFLDISYQPSSQNYIAVCDQAAWNPDVFKGGQGDVQWRIFLGGMFYKHQCQNPNFRCIRNGMSFLVECLDSSLLNNFDPSVMERMMVELFHHYPHKFKEWYFLNSNTIANMTYAVWKRFLPERLRKSFHLGYHLMDQLQEAGTRLDEFYNTPTPEANRDRIVLKVLRFLIERYRNQKEFSLAACTPVDVL